MTDRKDIQSTAGIVAGAVACAVLAFVFVLVVTGGA